MPAYFGPSMTRHVPMPLSLKELDLRSGHYGYATTVAELTDRMNAVPGFKTSAAFFTFLRANLVLLPQSTLNSNTSTPLLYPSSSKTLPPLLRHSSLATMTSNAEDDAVLTPNPLDSVPPLTTAVLTSQMDKVVALKLVADSIAQQRQTASRAVIFHPYTLAVYIVILAMISQFLYKVPGDIGILATTCAGVTMTCLVAVRAVTGGYINLAEEFNWKFIENEDGEDDIVIGSRFGTEIIGALILHLERNGNGGGKKKAKTGKTGGRGVVKAWTTRVKYRGKGVGTELLEVAAKTTKEKLGNSAEIGFAAEHANSKMILPNAFNGRFKKIEVKAAQALEQVIESMEPGYKKKR